MSKRHVNPDQEEMRVLLASSKTGLTEFDSTYYCTSSREKNPVEDFYYSRFDLNEVVQFQDWNIGNMDMIQVDGFLFNSPGDRIHVRLHVDADYAQLAAVFQTILFPINNLDATAPPEIVLVSTPGLKSPKLHKVGSSGFTRSKNDALTLVDLYKHEVRILGCDLFEEIQEAILLVLSDIEKERGNLLLRGALKSVSVPGEDRGVLILGSSDKQNTLSVFGGERNKTIQSSLVMLKPDGTVGGPLAGAFAHADGLDSSQRRLWNSATSDGSIFQNANVYEGGLLDLPSSPNAMVGFRYDANRHSEGFMEPRMSPDVKYVVFLDDDTDFMPGISRLTAEQFAAYVFIRGKSSSSVSQSSLADAIFDFVKLNKCEAFVLNVGSIAGGFLDIPWDQHQAMFRAAVLGSIEWKMSRELGVGVPSITIQGVDPRVFNPALIYAEDLRNREFLARAGLFREARKSVLSNYVGSVPEIMQSFGHIPVYVELEEAHKKACDAGDKAFMHDGVAYLTTDHLFSLGGCRCDNDIRYFFCPFHNSHGIHGGLNG
jgi:ATP-dependent phosphoenolpyruvate carboxykinase